MKYIFLKVEPQVSCQLQFLRLVNQCEMCSSRCNKKNNVALEQRLSWFQRAVSFIVFMHALTQVLV